MLCDILDIDILFPQKKDIDILLFNICVSLLSKNLNFSTALTVINYSQFKGKT